MSDINNVVKPRDPKLDLIEGCIPVAGDSTTISEENLLHLILESDRRELLPSGDLSVNLKIGGMNCGFQIDLGNRLVKRYTAMEIKGENFVLTEDNFYTYDDSGRVTFLTTHTVVLKNGEMKVSGDDFRYDYDADGNWKETKVQGF